MTKYSWVHILLIIIFIILIIWIIYSLLPRSQIQYFDPNLGSVDSDSDYPDYQDYGEQAQAHAPLPRQASPASNPSIFYYFYNPSCPPCKQFTPTWNDLVEKYSSERIIFEAINIKDPQNKNLLSNFSIERTPTLILVTESGDQIPYSGNRTPADIYDFIRKNT